MLTRFKVRDGAGGWREVPESEFRTKPGLGDRVERFAKPIAKALRLSCLDENGDLKPDSGCGKRKTWLNALTKRAESENP